MTWFAYLAIALIILYGAARIFLNRLNQRYVAAHANEVPQAFRAFIDPVTYKNSVAYTLAKSNLAQIEILYDSALLGIVLFSGFLPTIYDAMRFRLGSSVWVDGGFLFLVASIISLVSIPLDWYGQFHLEAKFGFNTTTPSLWIADRIKGYVLAVVLGFPLIVLLVSIVHRAGSTWWIWAWISLLVVQLLLMLLAPILILPLFNKFTPLASGALRDRLLALAARTNFAAQNIQVMDGSKRSKHSNAFFTGFGRFRKIVLFDTLIGQLDERELEAVLAHEIGHYKRRHIFKLLAGSAVSSAIGLYLLSWLARQDWFYTSFGFLPDNPTPALLLFALLSGMVSFWLSPFINALSRRFEYEADGYAAEVILSTRPLVQALRKLNEKNLSNLTPHPLYSGFYYSHPTLLERERSLSKHPNAAIESPANS